MTEDGRRSTWLDYFMRIVDVVASRATCDRGKGGALVVKDNQVISAGYVGAPSGRPHCDEVGHLFQVVVDEDGKERKHCVRTIHAEMNAIAQAAKRGASTNGAILYCSMAPCWDCGKLVHQSGIIRVICQNDYHGSERTKELFHAVGIALAIIEESFRY